MKSWVIVLSVVAAMILAACEQREQTGVTGQPRAEREGQVAGEPARQPATTDQQATTSQPSSQPSTERDIAGSPSTTVPPSDTMSRQESTQGQTSAQQSQDTGAQTGASDQVAGSPSQGTQPGTTPGRESEFFGQSPQFANAPETIVLKASNGNVTLPHKKHAETMDCKTCHGDATPGPIEGFNKEKAHSLCTGCHKEKGAGPTKCQECHKKQ
jgi:predicted CXXCH cytochrome family protein